MSDVDSKKKRQTASLTEARLKKIQDLEDLGLQAYSVGFVPDCNTQELRRESSKTISSDPEGQPTRRLAGRVMASRKMGKLSFVRLADSSGSIQALLARDNLGNEQYTVAKKLDVGDIVGLSGRPFFTKTNELTIFVDEFQILTKAVRTLPEKWHGLSDVETRYRQRYVDLIVNPAVREIVRKRSQTITYLREFLIGRGYLEVETPMMQAIPGGATAKPFETFHHALDRQLFLRIAPELYLKRLLVGGFERVFEINRNFRNEGVSTQHNPEFTMLEFYQAFTTYDELMDMTEKMICGLAREVTGDLQIDYGDRVIDLTPPWERTTVKEALLAHTDLSADQIDNRNALLTKAEASGLEVGKDDTLGKLQMTLFDEFVEEQLWGPIFVHQYPVEVSPLARRNEDDPTVTDRFELYMCGREMANAFTELTDPRDQRSRFEEQARARDSGDEEAHFLDEDFLRALEYGMPPAAGEGIGIDRLVMLLTNSHSIREVILFPHMRPESGTG